MEIGPVVAIRLVGTVLPSRPESVLDRVFASEFRSQDQDSSQTPDRRASRGLEDETPDDEAEEQEPGAAAARTDSSISIFA